MCVHAGHLASHSHSGQPLQGVKSLCYVDRTHAARGNLERLPMKTILAIALLLASTFALAHSGGKDANGCHNERRTGGYHCH